MGYLQTKVNNNLVEIEIDINFYQEFQFLIMTNRVYYIWTTICDWIITILTYFTSYDKLI